MKNTILLLQIIFALISTSTAFAQNNYVPVQGGYAPIQGEYVPVQGGYGDLPVQGGPQYYQQTQGCVLSQNPHSYACHAWTFQGTQMFPLNIMDGQALQGEWNTITYANPWTENEGAEFKMLKETSNPHIPTGVMNKGSNTALGSLKFSGRKVVWNNWRGKKLKTKLGEYAITDSYTIKFSFPDGNYEQSFICRDFNRNNKHHLLCEWYLIRFTDDFHSAYTYEFRGYFGFLKP